MHSLIAQKANSIKNEHKSAALVQRNAKNNYLKRISNIPDKKHRKLTNMEEDYGLSDCNSKHVKSKVRLSKKQSHERRCK